MRQSVRNRSRQEIICDILSTIQLASVSKTKVMYRASLSYAQLKSYENYLASNKIIKITDDGLWMLTEKGKQYHDACKLVEQIMKRPSEQSNAVDEEADNAVTANPSIPL